MIRFFRKTSSCSIETLLGFIVVVTLHRFKALLMGIFSTVSEKINVFLINTVLGQISVIANDMVFLKN